MTRAARWQRTKEVAAVLFFLAVFCVAVFL